MKFHRYLAVILASLAIFGCATKFAYNNIDWFIISYIEDLVPLNSVQESELENRLQDLQQWHKSTQLPLYIQQINNIQQQSGNRSPLILLSNRVMKLERIFELS